MKTHGFSLAFGAAVVLFATSIRAQQDYPIVIQNHLALQVTPPCSVCHEKGNVGSGTVVTSFGWAMRGQGLVVGDARSVTQALDGLRSARTDSDGDGVGDIDELARGTDPNGVGSVPLPNGEEPGYGCGGEAPDPNRRRREGLAPWPVALAVLLLVRRARRIR